MGVTVAQSYLSDILHVVSQSLLIPTILLLLAFIAYALFCIGSIVVEYFTERRNFKVKMPKFLAALMSAQQDEIPTVIKESGLLKRQKAALMTVYDYRELPGDALVALIRRLVNEEETRYDRISGRNNMAARISPMIGLMGTLIPLGPGIEALGRADTSALSSSLLIAFDTTVAGLIVAAICLVIGKIRSNWYGNYMSALDSAMATMLQKIEDMRMAGEIAVEEPDDYAFLYEPSRVSRGIGGEQSAVAQSTQPDSSFDARMTQAGEAVRSERVETSAERRYLQTDAEAAEGSMRRSSFELKQPVRLGEIAARPHDDAGFFDSSRSF